LPPRRGCGVAVQTITGWAQQRDVTVLGLAPEVSGLDCGTVAVDEAELLDRAGLLVSLGGDGTMLRAMRLVHRRGTPVLGVNVGRLGFLAESDIDELPGALSASDEHRYTVERRTAVPSVLADGTPCL